MSLQNVRWSVLLAGLFVVTALDFGAFSPTTPAAGHFAAPLSQQAGVSDRLYFGTAQPGGLVSEADWAAFLEDVVTPRFPQGLTVWSANGQWRDRAQRINRERTFVLEVVHPPQPAADAALKEIVAEYRRRFAQESVLWVRDRVNLID
jgi:hypothetical protein